MWRTFHSWQMRFCARRWSRPLVAAAPNHAHRAVHHGRCFTVGRPAPRPCPAPQVASEPRTASDPRPSSGGGTQTCNLTSRPLQIDRPPAHAAPTARRQQSSQTPVRGSSSPHVEPAGRSRPTVTVLPPPGVRDPDPVGVDVGDQRTHGDARLDGQVERLHGAVDAVEQSAPVPVKLGSARRV